MIQNDLLPLACPISQLTLLPGNPRRGDVEAVKASLDKFGQRKPIVVRKSDRVVIAGNHTLQAAQALGWSEIAVVWVDDDDTMSKAFALADNRTAELGDYDEEALAALIGEVGALDPELLEATGWDSKSVSDLLDRMQTELPVDVDEVPEDVPTISKLGDVWLLGEHRVMCGDSTDAKNVAKLMNGKTAQLLHADPPYGMGKENDGVLNDNLYASKLDEFQMAWWKTCRKFLDDNASAYIWGNPEDLWRLWYVGGLKDSERLTFRNEIFWEQVTGVSWGKDGMGNLRSYATMGERCLFFMFGEQGFNNNSDNYWEGWENVRLYLETEMEKCGGRKNWKAALGNQMGSHYFTKSQWCFPTQEAYEKLQEFARGDAFKQDYDALKQDYDALKQDYDALKQEFYSTRSHFDSSHDKMSDLWSFPRVTGEDRFGHPTPKPVEMMCRVFKSSAPKDSITLEPFGGSGSTLIAAQETNRIAYLMELDSHYVDVICARFQKHTGILPVLESDGLAHDFSADA